jgi:uncharacterized protein (TIGR00266 family)
VVSRPSYSAVKMVLKAGEEVHAESGAILALGSEPEVSGTMKGGILGALKRTVLTSESFFVTTIKATKDNTEVYLAPRATGDVEPIRLGGRPYIVQGGSFLASTPDVKTDTHFSGFKGFLSGEGIFMIHAEGRGDIFVSSFGGILKKDLAAGEKFIVDNGHIVAFPADMQYSIRNMGSGMVTAVTSGEGLACEFTGPGTIYLQTRNLAAQPGQRHSGAGVRRLIIRRKKAARCGLFR